MSGSEVAVAAQLRVVPDRSFRPDPTDLSNPSAFGNLWTWQRDDAEVEGEWKMVVRFTDI